MKIRYRLRALAGAVPRQRFRRQLHRFLAETADCPKTQERTLQRILSLNQDSDYSRQRGLHAGLSVASFRDRMPVSTYDEFRPAIEELKRGNSRALLGPENRLLMFSMTSGTTGDSKFVPITNQFLRDYRRGWQTWGIQTFDQFPDLPNRHIVQMSSSANQFQTSGNIPCGNISGLVAKMQHPLVRSMYCVPTIVGSIADCDARYYSALRMAVADANVGLFTTANPATLIHLARFGNQNAEYLIRDIADGTINPSFSMLPEIRNTLSGYCRKDPARAAQLETILHAKGRLYPRDYWPHLQTLAVWTCGSAGAWMPSAREYYGNVPTRDHGLHASEGRMTIPLGDAADGLLDIGSHFFEFIPVEEYGTDNPTVLLPHELEEQKNYYILLTTTSGLYRYDIRDVVKCTGFRGTTPSLVFQHKGAAISSVAGEKLTESQVVSAFHDVSVEMGIAVDHFTVAPYWDDPPRYQLLLDKADRLTAAVSSRLALRLDGRLKQLNCEYAEKRNSRRLARLECILLPPRTWRQFAIDRTKRSGGSLEQYKHPCLVNDLEFRSELESRYGIGTTIDCAHRAHSVSSPGLT